MPEWWRPSKAGRVSDKPWLHPDVIAYFESILHPDMRVAEHGSGGSTLWLAGRVKYLVSFEHNQEWRLAIEARKPGNCIVMPVAAGIMPPMPFALDLLFVDGEPVEDRALWLRAAPKLLLPGGWLVLDNANRPEYAAERADLETFATLVKTFDRNDHTRYLVTDFWRMYA